MLRAILSLMGGTVRGERLVGFAKEDAFAARVQTQLILNLFKDMHHSGARQHRSAHLHPSHTSSKSQMRCGWMLDLLVLHWTIIES